MKIRKLDEMDTTEYPGISYWVSVCYFDTKLKDKLIGPFSNERSAFLSAEALERSPEVIYAVTTADPLTKCLSARTELVVI